MAHFRSKKHLARKRYYLDRMSRIPYNEEMMEWYKISPSISALEADLVKLLNKAFNEKKDCVDGQNGNMLDNYIESWANLVKAKLKAQKTMHRNKIETLANVRKSIRKNAKDWIEVEKAELNAINSEINTLEKKYADFLSNKI